MPLYHVKHVTRYQYPTPVTDSANQIVLKPESSEYQEIRDIKITINPNVPIDYFTDYLGNATGVFTIIEPHSELEIVAELEVVTHPVNFPQPTAFPAEEWQVINDIKDTFEYLDFSKPDNYKYRAEVEAAVKAVAADASVFETVSKLAEYIYTNFTYKQGVTNVETKIDEVWELKAGVCQDFAHLLLEMLRTVNVPSRYISGYICPVNHELRGEGATHAWVEAFIPDYGWFGIDPTNNCWVSDRHIKIAYGRNFSDCTPVKGTYKGTSNHKLTVSVTISNEKGVFEDAEPIAPAYVAEAPTEVTTPLNSYQRFLDMQQQQQQQQ